MDQVTTTLTPAETLSYISHMVKLNFRIYTTIANNTHNILK